MLHYWNIFNYILQVIEIIGIYSTYSEPEIHKVYDFPLQEGAWNVCCYLKWHTVKESVGCDMWPEKSQGYWPEDNSRRVGRGQSKQILREAACQGPSVLP